VAADATSTAPGVTSEAAPAGSRDDLGPFSPPVSRRLPLDFERPCPPYWMGGSYSASCLLNAYSLMFPAMEAYMVRHMAELAKQPGSPVDQAVVRGFLQQEGAHAREHRRSVECVRAQGYEVDAVLKNVDKRVFRGLEVMSRLLLRMPHGKAMLMGMMAGGEHWTAAMSEMSFTPGVLAVTVGRLEFPEADPELSDMEILYLWHCAEELEHKSVAADVFAAYGGGELARMISFLLATMMFFVLTGVTFIPLLRQAPTALGPDLWAIIGDRGGWRGLAREFRISLRPMAGVYGNAIRQYLHKGYHPSQMETDALVRTALARLEELKDLRAAA